MSDVRIFGRRQPADTTPPDDDQPEPRSGQLLLAIYVNGIMYVMGRDNPSSPSRPARNRRPTRPPKAD